MRKLLVFAFPIITFAVNVPKSFVNAYTQGKEDEYREIKKELRDLKGIIEAMLKFREYLIAGKIPPPIVVEEKSLVSTPSGLKAVKKIRIYFPSELDFAKLEDIAVKLGKDYLPQSGYYVYFPIQNLADYQIGYLKLKLKEMGYKPFVYKDWLVAGVYNRKADAKKRAEEITETLRGMGVLNSSERFTYVFIEIPKSKGE